LFGLGKKRAQSDHFGAPLAVAAGVLVLMLVVVEARPAGFQSFLLAQRQNNRLRSLRRKRLEICHEAKVDAGNGEILHHDLEDEPDESDAGQRAGGF
jgi:hypothetical protein